MLDMLYEILFKRSRVTSFSVNVFLLKIILTSWFPVSYAHAYFPLGGQLLWSFCSTQVKEAEGGRKFHLNQIIPGANRTLEYTSDANMDQAGVANSMLSMVWE